MELGETGGAGVRLVVGFKLVVKVHNWFKLVHKVNTNW